MKNNTNQFIIGCLLLFSLVANVSCSPYKTETTEVTSIDNLDIKSSSIDLLSQTEQSNDTVDVSLKISLKGAAGEGVINFTPVLAISNLSSVAQKAAAPKYDHQFSLKSQKSERILSSPFSCGETDFTGVSTCSGNISDPGKLALYLANVSPSLITSFSIFDPRVKTQSAKSTAKANGNDEAVFTVIMKGAGQKSRVGVAPLFSLFAADGVTPSSLNAKTRCTNADVNGAVLCKVSSLDTGTLKVKIIDPPVKNPISLTFTESLIIPPTTTVAANNSSTVQFTLKYLDGSGNPRVGLTPTPVVTGSGTNTVVCAAADAQGLSVCTLRSNSAGTKSVSFGGEIFSVVFGEPNSSVTASSATVLANGDSEATVTVTLKNSSNAAIVGVVPKVTVDGSGINTVSCTSSNGSGVSVCKITSTTAGVKKINVIDPPVAPPVSVTFTTSQMIVQNSIGKADGTSQAVVQVRLLDANGQPIVGRIPTMSASGDAVVNCTPSDASGYSTCFVSSATAGSQEITLVDPSFANSPPVTVSFGDAKSSIQITDPLAKADGTDTAKIKVTYKNASGVVQVGATVVASSIQGATITCPVTDSSGVSICSVTATTPGKKKVAITSPLILPEIELTFGDPNVSMTVTAGNAAANGSSQATFDITMLDSSSNPVIGKIPDIAVSGSGTNTYSCSASNSSGVSTCTLTSTVGGAKQITVLDPQMSEPIFVNFAPSSTPPSLSIASANAQSGFINSATPITLNWSATSSASSSNPVTVDVLISSDGGLTWKVIEQGVANTGSYTWTPPNVNASGYMVQVVGSINGEILAITPSSLTIDNTVPTLTLSSAAASTVGAAFSVTVTASETVTGLTLSDFTVSNGTAGGLSGSGTSYSVTITPTAAGTVSVSIAASRVVDSAGNANSASNTLSRTYDTNIPSVVIASTASAVTSTSPIPVTVTFSRSVTGFVVGDLTLSGGTAGNFAGSGTSYTFDLTPTGQGTVTVNIAASVAQDSVNGFDNTVASPLSRVYDTVAPTVVIASTASANTNVSPIPVTVTFSEAVTGFVSGDVVVGNGTISGFTGSGTSYSFNVTPSGQGNVTVDVAGSVAQDAAGLNNTIATQLSRNYDSVVPTVTIASTASANTNVSPIPVTVTFSESVTGFISTDVVVGNGTISSFAGSGASYSFDVTPTAQGTVTVNIAGSVAQDATGNNNTAATQLSRVYDNVVPVLSGLSNDATPAAMKTWNFACTDAGSSNSCTYRFTVDTSAGTNPTGSYAALATASQSSGNGTYYIHVQAQDATGNVSTVGHYSVVIDNTIPTTPGTLTYAAYSSSLSQAPSATWVASTDTNGISKYQMAIGTSSGGTQVRNWTDIGTGTTFQATGLTLTDNTDYYISVRAVDNASLASAVASGVAWRTDTTASSGGSITYTNGVVTNTALAVTVDRGTDAQSGMSATNSDYVLEVASATYTSSCGSFGAFADASVTETAAATSYSYTGTVNNCYRFRYRVKNAAGVETIVTSANTLTLLAPANLTSSPASVSGMDVTGPGSPAYGTTVDVTFTNDGGVTATISAVAVSNATNFEIVTTGTTCTVSSTLAPAASCIVKVRPLATADGSLTGNLTVDY